MKTINVTATEARSNFFTLLNQAIYEQVRVVISKSGTEKTVELIAIKNRSETKDARRKLLTETYGMFKDVPESLFKDDRLRGKQAQTYLKRVRTQNA
ncbi:MAG: type II toxin-antitoxin system prevent-host-death family antitoxin [Patescibacteria group bacterium]